MAEKTLTTQIILRNGTTTEWEASTKVLKRVKLVLIPQK